MHKIKSIALIVLFSLILISCGPAATQPTPPAAATEAGGQVPATGATDTAVPEGTTPAEVEATAPASEGTATAPAGAGTAQATEEGAAARPELTSTELNLYAWSEYIPQDLLDGFENEYGVTVNYDTYSSNEELMAKLQAGASGYDVIIPSDYTVEIMVKQNMLEPLDRSQIPNFANIDEQFLGLDYDPNNEYTVPYQWGTVGLIVDTEQVTQPVDSWEDLWDPAYEGRVVLLDDERQVIGMALQVLGYDVNSTDPDELAEAKAKLQELLPNVKLFDSDSPKTAILSGEVWLGQTWNGEGALAQQENPNIEFSCPTEGCTIWFDNLAIPAGAPHKDAALAFIDYVLRPDVSIMITREFPYSNPNRAALELMQTEDSELYETYIGSPATNPTEEDIENAVLIKDLGEATILWDDIWTEVKGNQ